MAKAPVLLEIWFTDLRANEPLALETAWQRWLGADEITLPAATVRRHAHQILRLLISRHIGRATAVAPFDIGPLGKPRIAGSDVHFSISHTGNAALIAISGSSVGVDIETPRALRIPPSRRERMIVAANAIAPHLPNPFEPEGDAAVLRAWVRLEALAKANGDGMARLLTEFGILGGDAPETAEAVARRRLAGGALGSKTLIVRELALPSPYAGAIAQHPALAFVSVKTFPDTCEAIDGLMRR